MAHLMLQISAPSTSLYHEHLPQPSLSQGMYMLSGSIQALRGKRQTTVRWLLLAEHHASLTAACKLVGSAPLWGTLAQQRRAKTVIACCSLKCSIALLHTYL